MHEGTGKGVWFRLDRRAAPPAGPAGRRPTARRTRDTPSVGALTALLQINPDRHHRRGAGRLRHRPAHPARPADRRGRRRGAAGPRRRQRTAAARPVRPGAPRRRRHDPGAADRAAAVRRRAGAGRLAVGYAQPLATIVAERLSLHLENDRLRRADLRRQTWLTFLAEASELLAQSLDVNLTMALIPQLVVPRLGQWCAVHTTDAWGRLQLAAATHADEAALAAAARGARRDRDRTRSWPGSRRRPGWAPQVMFGTPPEGFAVPLVARGQRLGTLAVGRHLPAPARRRRGGRARGRRPPGRAGHRQRPHPRRAPQGRPDAAGLAAAAGAAARGRASGSPPSTCRPAPRWAATSTTSCRPDERLDRGGRRRLRQGRAGGDGDRAGPRRDPDPGRRRQADDRDPLPGQPDAGRSAAAAATARWRWPRWPGAGRHAGRLPAPGRARPGRAGAGGRQDVVRGRGRHGAGPAGDDLLAGRRGDRCGRATR